MLNKVQLIGNLGSDPEIRHTESGSVANFSIATTETWKDKNGEKQSSTEWHNIVVWGDKSDIIATYLKKGSKVYIEGKKKTRTYNDKDGIKRYAVDIVCYSFVFLDSKPEQTQQPTHDYNTPTGANNQSINDSPTDDLPFMWL